MTEGVLVEKSDNLEPSLLKSMNWQGLGNTIFIFSIFLLLAFGWYQRDDSYFEAESGIGYALGIIGGSLMILLLLYPLRKRLRAMDRMLSVKFWFRLHMLFGILGPVAILYHSSFSLGSTNSNVALICMLLVASSGLAGRYLYVRIHHGLYGAKTLISEYQAQTQSRREVLVKVLPQGEQIFSELDKLEKISLSPAHGLFHSLRLRRVTRREIRRVKKLLKVLLSDERISESRAGRTTARLVGQSAEEYFLALKRAAELQVNERLFSWWHILHLPLFIMMLIAGIVHVVVVHLY
jgi:hypothetical protein